VEYNNIDSVQLGHFEGPAARRGEGAMKSTVVKRSVVLAGHKTSVSLEDPFWEGLKEIAKAKRQSLSELVGCGIDTDREHANLSLAIRLFVLNHYKAARSSVGLAA